MDSQPMTPREAGDGFDPLQECNILNDTRDTCPRHGHSHAPREAGEDGLVELLGDVLDIIHAAERQWANSDEHHAYYTARFNAVREAVTEIANLRAALERERRRVRELRIALNRRT